METIQQFINKNPLSKPVRYNWRELSKTFERIEGETYEQLEEKIEEDIEALRKKFPSCFYIYGIVSVREQTVLASIFEVNQQYADAYIITEDPAHPYGFLCRELFTEDEYMTITSNRKELLQAIEDWSKKCGELIQKDFDKYLKSNFDF